MIKVENIETWGFEHAIRGMRNPLNSWDKSDSYKTHIEDPETLQTADFQFFVGENDLELMKKLFAGGTEHRKFLRQIMVSMDITAPLYWWKEFDTYKVGTVANSCSTMHKIAAKEFELDDFSYEHLVEDGIEVLKKVIYALNGARAAYLNFDECRDNLTDEFTCKKDVWWQLIQLLPSSYNQRRTVTMNYENVVTIIKQRTGHKLDEWNDLVKVLSGLPYVSEIMKK